MKFKIFPGIFFLLSIIASVSAVQPSSEEVLGGNITSGLPVTVKRVIDFPPSGSAGTFPSDHNLVITTRLENPTWTYSLVLDGVQNPGKTVTTEQLTLSGFELNYPSDVKQSVVIILNGTAPGVSRATMTSVMYIYETDGSGQMAPNTSRSDSQLPIHPRVTTTPTTVPTTQKGGLVPFPVLCALAGACGIVALAGKSPSAGYRE